MLDDFLIRAALAGVATAMAAGLLGCFVVWRRMAYFGDATAHAAVLGVAISLGFGLSIFAGVGIVALAMALLIHTLATRGPGVNTLLGVLAHGALALGLVAVALMPGQRIDLDAYLFGDILLISRFDLVVIWGGAAVVGAILCWNWSALLTATLSPDLAYAAGLNPKRAELVLTLLMALVVAVAIKVVGALLITALLIIPSATARNLSRTPEQMAVVAMAMGALAAIAGIRVAVIFDLPVGPAIICVTITFFAFSVAARSLISLQRGG